MSELFLSQIYLKNWGFIFGFLVGRWETIKSHENSLIFRFLDQNWNFLAD